MRKREANRASWQAIPGALMLGVAVVVPARAQQQAEPGSEVTVEQLDSRLADLERSSGEWRTRDSAFHLAGYADAGYADRSGGDGGFDLASFNPIFHYQYLDRILLEAEFATLVAEDGETEIELEYGTVDVMLNDNVALIAGKFLSPIGYFQQNLHPSWINKLPSVPLGFGHDGAAPATELGVQLRGGFALARDGLWTYAVYVGNGPELEAEDGEIMAVESEGFARDAEGGKVWGGRLSLLPVSGLEIGLSAATGEAAVTSADETMVDGDPARDYDAYGVDVSWKWGKQLDFRGEYVRQSVGAEPASLAPDKAAWRAWYVQAAYAWPETKWELVTRYGQFRAPDEEMELDQAVFGVNYWLTANAVAKTAFEWNDAAAGSPEDGNRWLLQIAYGF